MWVAEGQLRRPTTRETAETPLGAGCLALWSVGQTRRPQELPRRPWCGLETGGRTEADRDPGDARFLFMSFLNLYIQVLAECVPPRRDALRDSVDGTRLDGAAPVEARLASGNRG